MATRWPEKRRLLGTKIPRIDGGEKSTGRAKYSFDMNLPDMLHATIVRCPHARAKIKKIDASAAEKAPGVKAVYLMAKVNEEVSYPGWPILALAAETEEQMLDAARLVKVEYEELPFQVKVEDVREKDLSTCPEVTVKVAGQDKNTRENLLPPILPAPQRGDVEKALQDADVVSEGTYGMAVIAHQCLESHGMVAAWNKDQTELTVYASTQATRNVASQLAEKLLLAAGKVTCITHHMGGGYGSKFTPDPEGEAACELARKAGRPVKLLIDRADEVVIGGSRPSAYGKVRLGAKKDGTITAIDCESWGTSGFMTGNTVGPMPYVYNHLPNIRNKHQVIRINMAKQRAMRAPGHPQSCFLTDCALDDLAAKLNMDPLEVRLKNLPPSLEPGPESDPLAYDYIRTKLYRDQLGIAAARMKWKEKWHPPGAAKGVVKHGMGMALHTWGGSAAGDNQTTVQITKDGTVLATSSTQDLGTAQRTVTAIVVAEILGLKVEDITVKIGESPMGLSTGSGGSTTCPSQAPAALQAAAAARDELFDKIASRLGSKKEDLSAENGKIVDKGRDKSWSWKEACARLGMDEVKVTGKWSALLANQKDNRGISKVQVGGVQAAEVLVDTETGVVRVTKVVAVQDCGLIINKLACESQVAGGVIMGLNYALFEENILDRHTGRQVNPDMEFYKLGGIKDMPQIIVHMMDMPERGVIGIGEPPTISTHAAIANAIHNALGVRVPETPFTPERVLAALAKKGGK